jgi:hypothetical protein
MNVVDSSAWVEYFAAGPQCPFFFLRDRKDGEADRTYAQPVRGVQAGLAAAQRERRPVRP